MNLRISYCLHCGKRKSIPRSPKLSSPPQLLRNAPQALSVATFKNFPLSLGNQFNTLHPVWKPTFSFSTSFRNSLNSIKGAGNKTEATISHGVIPRIIQDHWLQHSGNQQIPYGRMYWSWVAACPIWTLLCSTSSERQMYWILLSIGQQMILVAESIKIALIKARHFQVLLWNLLSSWTILNRIWVAMFRQSGMGWFNIHPHRCVSHFPLCHLFPRLNCRPLSWPHPLHHHWLRGWFRSFWGCFFGKKLALLQTVFHFRHYCGRWK